MLCGLFGLLVVFDLVCGLLDCLLFILWYCAVLIFDCYVIYVLVMFDGFVLAVCGFGCCICLRGVLFSG